MAGCHAHVSKSIPRAPQLSRELAARALPACRLLSSAHPSQTALLSEPCILVDAADRVVGSASKEFCHRAANVRSGRALHRAFSLFVLDGRDRLLMQRRSLVKLTFPGRWTNSCCSHPLHTEAELRPGVGVKVAAARRARLELGVELPAADMRHLGTIVYQAECGAGGEWAEHEVDHVLGLRLPAGRGGDLRLRPDPNEVAETAWVARADLDKFVAAKRSEGQPPTPWLELILSSHRQMLELLFRDRESDAKDK